MALIPKGSKLQTMQKGVSYRQWRSEAMGMWKYKDTRLQV